MFGRLLIFIGFILFILIVSIIDEETKKILKGLIRLAWFCILGYMILHFIIHGI